MTELRTDKGTVKNNHDHGLSQVDPVIADLQENKASEAYVDAVMRKHEEEFHSTPDPEPEPEPPPGEPAFLSRPASGPIVKDGGSSAVVSNVTIRGNSPTAPSGIGITIRNVNGTITIRDVDLADLVGGIFIQNCSGVLLIENVRSRNIGDGTIGSGHSNHIQLAECSFSGFIHKNRFLGGRTEDMLSTWHSGGKGVGQELIIEDNKLEGRIAESATVRAWTSGSGTGIIMSDGAGSSKNGNVIVRRNTLLNPGQVGLQMIDGPNIQVYENVVLEQPYAKNNNAITSWEGSPKGICRDNRYYVTKSDGSHPDPWLHQSPSGIVMQNNIEDPSLNAATLAVVL